MLKLRADGHVLLGLSEENLKRLRDGQPIAFDGEELGLGKVRIGIFYGETEDDMVAALVIAGIKIPP